MPEWASRHHLEQVNAIVDEALAHGGREPRRHRAGRGHPGPGAGRRAADRRRHRQGPRRLAPAAAGRRRPPAGPRRGELPRRGAVRAAVHLPAGQRRPHAAGAGHRPRGLRDARPDARRRRRRGVRQGRAAARPRLPGRPGAVQAGAATGDPTAFKFPIASRMRRAGLLLRRPEDRAALQGARPRPGGDGAPRRRPRRELRARDRRGADRARRDARWRPRASRGWRSAAASPRTACCASARWRSASRSTSRRASCAPTTRR